MIPQHRCIMVHNTCLQSLYVVQACSPPVMVMVSVPVMDFSPSPPVGMGGPLGHHLCLSVSLSLCLSVCLSGWLSVCLSVCLSVSLKFVLRSHCQALPVGLRSKITTHDHNDSHMSGCQCLGFQPAVERTGEAQTFWLSVDGQEPDASRTRIQEGGYERDDKHM